MYDEVLAARVRNVLAADPDAGDQALEALAEPHVRPMDFTGRPLKGFVYVEPEGTRSAKDLTRWVSRSIRHVVSLPPKGGKTRTAGTSARRKSGEPR